MHDNANIFSSKAVENANRDMKKMTETHNKDLVIETFAAIPDEQKDAYASNGSTFFKDWMASRAKELKVNGVYVLICMDPKHLEVGAGKNTIARGDFSQSDVDGLYAQMKEALHNKDYDKALSGAVDTVKRPYTANISGSNGRSTATSGEGGYSSGQSGQTNGSQQTIPTLPGGSGMPLGFGSIICMVVAGVLIISLVRSIFRGTNGGGYTQGGQWGGTNYGGGNYGGNTGGGFGGVGGGGSGFGRGFLGGLLGGALGGYAADRFDHRNDPSGGGMNTGGQGNAGGSFGGGGGSFDAGPSDAGQDFGGGSSGGDFGSSGGGGDAGGGGGGGGGSSGGDF